MFISYDVHIDAPPQQIWDVLLDIERWPEFAPQFKSIVREDKEPLAIGKKARVTPHGFFGSVWTVSNFEPGRSFEWESDMLPGVHMAGNHIVETDGEGSKVTMSLDSSGPLAPVIALALGRIFRRNTQQEVEGLKAHIEADRT
ncbi:MAG: SRPBCC family protein [Chloroflexi bacterium]|nr:SRPBCC family protein [Chloroflexota bacterium]